MDYLLERMTRQGLSERSSADAVEVAGAALGLQAQDAASAWLGVRARSTGPDEAAVVEAGEVHRGVVRSWLMRATVHLVPAADLRWLTALCAPMIERRFANIRWRQLGIDGPLIDRAVPLAHEVLAGRRLTRREVAAELADRGVRLADDPAAATHLVLALSCRGVLCRVGDRGREALFALVEDWVPSELSVPAPADPVAELARRYFRAFGPATAADFATFSGLPSGAAIRAISDELTEVSFDGRRGWTLGTVEPAPGLRLLPMFDNYLIGYRDRSGMLDPARYAQVYVGGVIKASVVCDGRVIGSWRLARSARSTTATVTPFERFTRRHLAELDRERADLERFLGRPVGLSVDG